MSEHRATIAWTRGDVPFTYESYPRAHTIAFKDGAVTLKASAAPDYRGDAGLADPEEMFVAALSSCHMLSFLAIAAKRKLDVLSYRDEAVGFLENDGGRLWIARVVLRPAIAFAGAADPEIVARTHDAAHHACFIANSVKTKITIEPG